MADEPKNSLLQLLEHKLLLAAFAAAFVVVGALINGYFQIKTTKMQIDATIRHAPPSLANKDSVQPHRSVSEDTVHTFVMNLDGRRLITAHSNFRNAPGYQVRFEGCYFEKKTAFCAFTIKADQTVVITSVENKSHATRTDATDATACCISLNDGSPWSTILATADRGSANVMRHTLSDSDTETFLLAIPDFNKGAPLDSLTFSRGQGDPGLEFKMSLLPLPSVAPVTEAQLRALKPVLQDDKRDGILGNPKGAITVVEFLDYQCPYCRAGEPELEKVLAGNSDVRLVIKQFPILDRDKTKERLSFDAARLSLAAVAAGSFAKVHKRLMQGGKLLGSTISELTANLHIDADDSELGQYIDQSKSLARSINLTGTPSFLIGGTMVESMDPAAIQKAISRERKAN